MLNNNLENLPYVRISPVADSNGNQLPPSSFRDSALSIGYTHGSYFGLDVTAYIPIITMRWYDSSENLRTIQYALSGITTYTRYSVSPTEWSQWTKGATQSQIDSINSSMPVWALNNHELGFSLDANNKELGVWVDGVLFGNISFK